MSTLNYLFELINKGRAINWIITFLYFIVFTIFLEKFIYFIKTRYNFYKILNSISKIKEQGDIIDILEDKIITKYRNSQVVILLKTYIENYKNDTKSFNEVIEEKGLNLVEEMEGKLWVLSEIGHIAPLLGLLGTITGLIRVFNKIAEIGGDVDVGMLSAGIWEAMLTTANGLIVAIPAFLTYKFFDKLVEKRSNDMSRIVSRLNVTYQIGEEISFTNLSDSQGDTIDAEV